MDCAGHGMSEFEHGGVNVEDAVNDFDYTRRLAEQQHIPILLWSWPAL